MQKVKLSLFLFLALLIFSMDAGAFLGKPSLKKITTKVASKLKKDLGPVSIYLRPENFRQAEAEQIPKLSLRLCSFLKAALSKRNFTMAESAEDAAYQLTGTFEQSGENVNFFFEYKAKDSVIKKSIHYATVLSKLSRDDFEETIDTKALKMAVELQHSARSIKKVLTGTEQTAVFINPIVVRHKNYSTNFSENFLFKIKEGLVKSDMFKIVEKVRANALTRALKRLEKVKSLKTSDAALAGAQSVLNGVYSVSDDIVTVNITIKDIDGTIISTASEDIPLSLIAPSDLQNPQAEKIADMAGTAIKTDEIVKISTIKGSGQQTFYQDEVIQFLVLVARPLYVYIYNIDSHSKVELLYPPADKQSQLKPGRGYIIPTENANWEIVVDAPYGSDNVKIFASHKPLPFPQLIKNIKSIRGLTAKKKVQIFTNQKQINPLDLVDYYKGVTTSMGAELYQDSIFIKTCQAK